jgi:hypothetical protein
MQGTHESDSNNKTTMHPHGRIATKPRECTRPERSRKEAMKQRYVLERCAEPAAVVREERLSVHVTMRNAKTICYSEMNTTGNDSQRERKQPSRIDSAVMGCMHTASPSSTQHT